MPTIISTGIAPPEHRVGQAEVKPFIRDMFADIFSDIDRLLTIFENTHIESRHFCVPLDWFQKNHTFAEKNERYIEQATELSIRAFQTALDEAELKLDDISHLYFVSSSGLATPSMDARILNEMKAEPHTKRTPLWGLGCGGGAAGLARAFEYVQAYPTEIAVVIAVELCGLTFQRNDLTKSNLVATSLFGDGAAAVIVAGSEAKVRSGIKLKASHSVFWPDTLDVMGWNFSSSGFHVVFSRDIPTMVHSHVAPEVSRFIKGQGLNKIDHYILHPGGKKVLDAFRESLGIREEQLDIPELILKQYGNMSSCTVLYVLDEFLRQQRIQAGESGLIAALGPGFSLEMLTVEGRDK
ncbi:hypothetical protein BEP19_09705 [Ammoniphilus oxalaticus]|uniref:Chalcone synthase n=1 Tax=Ammoniphilus oxalaticus TaxID=66863 RepID=A0A419SL08_9BACL|nr:3-oxoacyl-[acyl-carrier-protein] synthase III C-terminal domain-containing protein [Ammoniphilus oxalaticus]RKD24639.1 hypothetical protein BEP19_09705 [Ammoniphilus oxalaticus]